jgi:hypothetical protein
MDAIDRHYGMKSKSSGLTILLKRSAQSFLTRAGDNAMATTEASHIQQRAESLAVVYLTRRDDLMVARQQEDSGLNLLVTIGKNEKPGDRVFGVIVRASIDLPKSTERSGIIKIPHKISQIKSPIELPVPVCLFYFTTADDRGYYRWLLEPDTSERDYAYLKQRTNKEFKKLTDNEMSKIVSQVNSWYEGRANKGAV